MDIFDIIMIKNLCGGGSGANPNIINSDNKKLGDLSKVAVGYKETNPGVVITWDGVTTGKDSITINGYSLYKVADYPTVTPQTVVLAGAVEGDVFENYTAQMFSIGDGNYICGELVFIMKAGIYESMRKSL